MIDSAHLPRETFETIAAWGLETFGPVEFARIAERANEEMKELLANPESIEEAADIVIILTRWPNLWQAIERKMAINRARTWRLMGDGTGYHIPQPLPQSKPHPRIVDHGSDLDAQEAHDHG